MLACIGPWELGGAPSQAVGRVKRSVVANGYASNWTPRSGRDVVNRRTTILTICGPVSHNGLPVIAVCAIGEQG